MADEHPNIALLKKLDLKDLSSAEDLFAPGVVFHFYNPNLPEIEGDYKGLAGVKSFFASIGSKSGGTFRVDPVSATPVGDELVVTHTRNTMTLDEHPITVDVVVVWRIVDGRITEVWDIPSAHTLAKPR